MHIGMHKGEEFGELHINDEQSEAATCDIGGKIESQK
jgi:hypothetical protein